MKTKATKTKQQKVLVLDEEKKDFVQAIENCNDEYIIEFLHRMYNSLMKLYYGEL